MRAFILPLVIVAGCGNHLTLPDAGVPIDMQIPGPTMLASAQTFTPCLAVDSRNVYWSDFATGTPTILSVPLGGGTPSTVVAGGDKDACVVSDGGNELYYADNGNIMHVHYDGSGKSTLATGQHVLKNRLSFFGSVYFITDVYGNVDAYNGKNAIVTVAPTGGVSIFYAGVIGLPGGIIGQGNGAFFSDEAGVFYVGQGAATPIAFGTSALHDNAMAVDSNHLAMSEIMGVGSGDVALFRLDGTGRTVLLPSLANPLAVDNLGVYVNHAGALERLKLDGSGATLLATQSPRALVLSADHIYFTDGAAIYSLPK